MALPTNQANALFDPASLENTPEYWDTDPKYSQLFKDAMQETLLGPIKDFDGQIALVKKWKKYIRMPKQQI